MRNVLLTTTMLATLSITAIPALAQEGNNQEQSAPQNVTSDEAGEAPAPTELVVAYEQYAAALLAYQQFEGEAEQKGNGQAKVKAKGREMIKVESREEAVEIVMETREQLIDICAQLETPDLESCLNQYIPPGQRLPDDVDPLADEAATSEMSAETEAVVTDESGEAQNEGEAAAASEAQSEGQADAETEQAEATQETEAQIDVQESAAPSDEGVSVDVQAEAQAEMTAETPPELVAAYEEYVAARMAFTDAQAAGEDTTVAAETAQATRQNLEAICAELGAPDLETCLDQYIPEDMRMPNDLAPLEMTSEASNEETNSQAEAPASEQTSDETVAASDSDAPAEPVEGDVAPEDVAPVLDSAKEATSAPADAEADATMEAESETSGETEVKEDTASQPESDAPPPENDAEAQADVTPSEIKSITEEEGQPVADEEQVEASITRSAPQEAEVVEQDQSDFRIVFEFNNQTFVESKDNARLEQGADDIYVERLSDGRTRETILRADGSEVVTIYNRNGDIVRRSRFTPEGEEIVLVYVDESHEEDLLEWRDPAEQLGPLRLDIALSEYVLDADEADQDELVQFLDQPPVERVQRLYSINEVKRSARIRDMVRRLEIGGLTFEMDEATIPTDQVSSLAHVADAMLDLLDRNPAETFLIEGHTDAVGDEIYNLKLSDRRAETVAVVLSQAFGIPPENLATQGYGERYLKVRTQQPERRNRRVTIKRITPLVSPVARR